MHRLLSSLIFWILTCATAGSNFVPYEVVFDVLFVVLNSNWFSSLEPTRPLFPLFFFFKDKRKRKRYKRLQHPTKTERHQERLGSVYMRILTFASRVRGSVCRFQDYIITLTPNLIMSNLSSCVCTNLSRLPSSIDTWYFHLTQQTWRTLRKPCCHSCPPNPRATCLSPAVSVGWSDPVPACTRELCRRNRIYSRSSRGRSQRIRRCVSGRRSIRPRLTLGRRKRRTLQRRRGRSRKRRSLCCRLCSALRSFVKLSEKNGSWTPWGRNKPNEAENQFERAGVWKDSPIPYLLD